MSIKRTKLTPPMIARRWGTGVDKVRTFIRSGELRATNLSLGSERPRFVVDLDDLAAFEKSREVPSPAPETVRQPSRSSIPQYV